MRRGPAPVRAAHELIPGQLNILQTVASRRTFTACKRYMVKPHG